MLQSNYSSSPLHDFGMEPPIDSNEEILMKNNSRRNKSIMANLYQANQAVQTSKKIIYT